MPTTPLSHAAHLLGALLLALATSTAQAQSYSPGRATRMNLAEGTVSLAPAGSDSWNPAPFQRPLADGDRLHTAAGARAELHSGSTVLRLQGPGVLEMSEQTDTSTRLALTQGTLALRVRQLYPGDTLEINTPNLAFTPSQPGEYRLDVDARFGTTTITLRSGQAVVYGENGVARSLASPQQLRFMDRLLGQEVFRTGLQRDAFDLWTAARDRAAEATPGLYDRREAEAFNPAYPQPRYAPYPVPYPIVVPFPVDNHPRFEPDRRRPPPPPDWSRPPRPFGPPPTRIEPMVQPPPQPAWPQPPMPMPRPEMRMHDAPRNQAELEQRAQMQRQQQIDRERQQQERNRQQMQAPQAPLPAPMQTRPMPRPQLLEPR